MKRKKQETLTPTEKVISSKLLSQEQKDLMLSIFNGERIAPLTSAVMSERLFSPDSNPDRFDFILQRVMKDPTLISDGSATNIPPGEFADAKKAIFDLPGWIEDGRYSNIEMQAIAQEFFYNRIDIYSSRMLMLQYAPNSDHHKSEVTYQNVKGVVVVALMKESPSLFKNYDSPRYIHRFTEAISDTGIHIPMLRNIAFVQLDKALEQFLNETYNEDEDLELLTMLALIADPNNEKVKAAVKGLKFFENIYVDATKYSQNKEVQTMLFEEELAIMDWNSNIKLAEDNGVKATTELFSWLKKQHRQNDILKAVDDPAFLSKLFTEYDEWKKNNNSNN